jgi:hypothetical protein
LTTPRGSTISRNCYSNSQDPGPPGFPQLEQASAAISSEEFDAAPNAVFEIAEKVDSFLCRSAPRHAGQDAAGEDVRTSVSNS